jgi:DNA-binding transcriptional ArsR family regulator
MNIHEATGVLLVPAKSRNLPNRILRAFDNAKHLQGLKRGVKDTLAELCRFVSQNRPFDTIFAHKETIAQRIGMSERSIYRHLESLQQAELIIVEDQERKSRNGRFSVARIRLTRKAAALLGFIEAPEEMELITKDDNLKNVQRCPTTNAINPTQDGGNKPPATVIHNPPSAKMSTGHTLSVPTISKSQPLQRIENGLPIDLSWLTGNGISRAGVFKLMGLAKANAKRLSDIVITMHEKLLVMKGGRLFAYLAKLAAGPTDFSVTATTERQRLESGKGERVMASKIAVFRERFKNVCLTNAQQTRLYAIDGNTRFVQVFGGPYPCSAPMNDLREWIHGVESGKLVFATLETEQKLRM